MFGIVAPTLEVSRTNLQAAHTSPVCVTARNAPPPHTPPATPSVGVPNRISRYGLITNSSVQKRAIGSETVSNQHRYFSYTLSGPGAMGWGRGGDETSCLQSSLSTKKGESQPCQTHTSNFTANPFLSVYI